MPLCLNEGEKRSKCIYWTTTWLGRHSKEKNCFRPKNNQSMLRHDLKSEEDNFGKTKRMQIILFHSFYTEIAPPRKKLTFERAVLHTNMYTFAEISEVKLAWQVSYSGCCGKGWNWITLARAPTRQDCCENSVWLVPKCASLSWTCPGSQGGPREKAEWARGKQANWRRWEDVASLPGRRIQSALMNSAVGRSSSCCLH